MKFDDIDLTDDSRTEIINYDRLKDLIIKLAQDEEVQSKCNSSLSLYDTHILAMKALVFYITEEIKERIRLGQPYNSEILKDIIIRHLASLNFYEFPEDLEYFDTDYLESHSDYYDIVVEESDFAIVMDLGVDRGEYEI